MDRYARQMRLAEVGRPGQARIEAARIDVPLSGLAAEVAVRYLAAAGVGFVRVRDAALAGTARSIQSGVDVEIDPRLEATDETMTFGLADPIAREVASGAHAALRGLRAALQVDS
jgi:molybdopterin-synthase adenylyltransferase